MPLPRKQSKIEVPYCHTFSLCYQELLVLLLPQRFRAMWQRKKRPEGRYASN